MAFSICNAGTKVSTLATPLSARSVDFRGGNTLLAPICVPAPRQRIPKVIVKAAKYKGTLMREKQLTEMIESKVKEATQVCDGDETSDECKVAWDEVEEVSQAKADLRRKLKQNRDPLESFCEENPESDECRIYED